MADNYVGFVDVGVLRALRRSYFRPQGRVIIDWFRNLEKTDLSGERFLRIYWYDGAFRPEDRRYHSQRRMFDAIESIPGIQLRLGHLTENDDKKLQQKGVDTLLTLDLVRLAGRSAYTTAILVVNDGDFSEAIRSAQDFGVRVFIATPNKYKVAVQLKNIADGVITIPKDDLLEMMPEKNPAQLPPKPNNS